MPGPLPHHLRRATTYSWVQSTDGVSDVQCRRRQRSGHLAAQCHRGSTGIQSDRSRALRHVFGAKSSLLEGPLRKFVLQHELTGNMHRQSGLRRRTLFTKYGHRYKFSTALFDLHFHFYATLFCHIGADSQVCTFEICLATLMTYNYDLIRDDERHRGTILHVATFKSSG